MGIDHKQSNWRIKSQRQTSLNNDKRGLHPSRTPNSRGESGSNIRFYLFLGLLPTLIGGALLVNWLLQLEPYSFDRWEAPPISSPQKEKR